MTEEFPLGVFSAGNVGKTLNSGVWWFWLSIVLIIIVLLFVGNLERSRVGRAWVAIREDEDAAEIMGVPTFKFKLWAFVIGAMIGGMSGALYAGQVQFVVPTNFNVVNSVLFLCAVVLGGQGNKLGRHPRRVHHRVPAELLPRPDRDCSASRSTAARSPSTSTCSSVWR